MFRPQTLFSLIAAITLALFMVASGGAPWSTPDHADAGDLLSFSISGVVWDDTSEINGQPDAGEGAPSAEVGLDLCLWDEVADDCGTEFRTGLETDGSYEFEGLEAGLYEICLVVIPEFDWTLTMVQLNKSVVSAGDVPGRCIEVDFDQEIPPATTVDWGIANVTSEFSFTKECDTDSLEAEEINCTLMITNVGDTVLFSRTVWDGYNCDGLELISSDPTPQQVYEEGGDCEVAWRDFGEFDELDPGESEQYELTFVPVEGAVEAINCVSGAAWNVRILLDDQEDYNAWWEDVFVVDAACVEFASVPAPAATPTPTSTPAPESTPTPTPAVLEEVAEPEALPDSGGAPSDANSGTLPWLAAIAGALALTGASSGLWLAYRRRRVR